jgi:hypothetical protein
MVGTDFYLDEPIARGYGRIRVGDSSWRVTDEAQASVCIGEDAHDVGSAADFLVEAFEHIGALEMLMVLAREPVEREGFLDGFLDHATSLG